MPRGHIFPTQLGAKRGPKWSQDGPKMASWRVLGPLGGQDGPKMEPRGFQERNCAFVPPMLGPKMGPNFGHCRHQSGLEEAPRSTRMTCCVKTPIFKRKWSSQDPGGHLKIKQKCGRVVQNQGLHFYWKDGFGKGSWHHFRWVLEPKLGPSWTKMGTKLAQNGS